MKDQFAGIREFVATVDGGSFTAAAERLGVTGSAVGKSVTRLEKRLGVQLLQRSTRRMSLTAEGEFYLGSCRRILEELELAETVLISGNEKPVGRLRIDLPTTFGRRHILPALLDLGLRHEGLDLAVSLRDRAVDLFSEGVDLAVRIGGLPDYPDIVARRLGEQKMILCAAPSYLRRRGLPLSRSDLARHDCLLGWGAGRRASWLLKNDLGRLEAFEVNARHELADGDALLQACIAGCGLAQMPSWLAGEPLQEGALLVVLPELGGGVMPIHVLWQKTWQMQPKLRVTVDELCALAERTPAVFSPT